jgi:ribokinase
MPGILVVGALHLDVVVDAPRLPALDETLMGSAVAYRFGGKGGNQAVMAARMGAAVHMAGQVGDDEFAAPVLDALARAGVDATQVRRVPGATGMSVAIVEPGGEYGAVVVSGVNAGLDAAAVDPDDAEILLLQNEIPEAVNRAVAARAGTARVILNAAPAREVSPALMRAVDLLVVNRVEAAQMLGRDPATLDGETAARDLRAQGPGAVIVTLGAEGGAVCDATGIARYAPPARATGSAHGAGDAFVGALAAELATGKPLAEATGFAARAAACFVATPPDARETLTRAAVTAWRAGS